MKKNHLSKTFVLGIGSLVLIIATAISFALDECNKMVRSEKKEAADVCFDTYKGSGCFLKTSEECFDGTQGFLGLNLLEEVDSGEYYFGRKSGGATDHAIVAGTVLCGYMHDCILTKEGCVQGEKATDPQTDKPIERHVTYYDNASCTIGG